ncbi:hypothetical protein CsSME_00041834 [Camellia sinensis var. sinensis]
MMSLYEVFVTIDSDECREHLVQPSSHSISLVLSDQMALVAKSGSRGSSGSITCHHCSASEHVKAHCFKLHLELRQCSTHPRGPGSPHTATLTQLGQLQA